jgi:hypothetical protein
MKAPVTVWGLLVALMIFMAHPVGGESYSSTLLTSMQGLVEQTYLEPFDSPNPAGATSVQMLSVLAQITARAEIDFEAPHDLVKALDVLDSLASVNNGHAIAQQAVLEDFLSIIGSLNAYVLAEKIRLAFEENSLGPYTLRTLQLHSKTTMMRVRQELCRAVGRTLIESGMPAVEFSNSLCTGVATSCTTVSEATQSPLEISSSCYPGLSL